jgi:hypothetical protein
MLERQRPADVEVVMRTQRLVGSLLIGFGVFLLIVYWTGIGGEAVPLVIGISFLAAYAVTRTYGLLVPGGILTGLGTGIVLGVGGGPETSPVLGLGLGFVAIYVISLLARDPVQHWWPLIPGGILTVIGLSTMPATRNLVTFVVPAVLILAGAAVVVGFGRPQVPRPRH